MFAPYEIRRSERARRVRITVHHDERVVLTVPRLVSDKSAHAFLETRIDWIKKTVERFRKRMPGLLLPRLSRRDYTKHKEAARQLIEERLLHWNSIYKFVYHRVSIRKTRSRWGSCSKKGNLNFNYRILFLPPELVDYVIVHELCHLQELNHGRAFWELVGQTIPDYKAHRRALQLAY